MSPQQVAAKPDLLLGFAAVFERQGLFFDDTDTHKCRSRILLTELWLVSDTCLHLTPIQLMQGGRGSFSEIVNPQATVQGWK